MNIREETDQLIEISLRYMVAKGCRKLISKSRSWQAEVSLRLGNYYVWTEVELRELIYHLCKCTVSAEWTETIKTQVPATLGLKVLSHGTSRTFSSWSLEGAFWITGTGRACRLSLSSPLSCFCAVMWRYIAPSGALCHHVSFHHRPKAAGLTF